MLFLFNFILGPLLLLVSPRYEVVFSTGYADALNYIQQNTVEINSVLSDKNGEREIMISVVFPELVRYSLLIDYFQETAMEIVYINYGKEKADFSLGRFQIKPSFIEKMEHFISKSPLLINQFKPVITYSNTDEKNIRAERIKRIGNLRWQLTYLKCFFAIMNERFSVTNFKDRSEVIRFYATAYNHNFLASKEEIERWMMRETYPYGAGSSQNKYSYSNISVYFYKNDWPGIFNKSIGTNNNVARYN